MVLETIFSYVNVKTPMTINLIPLSIVQEYNGQRIQTKLQSKGWGQWAKIAQLNVNEKLFPNVAVLKPLAVVRVSDFKMTFPVPTFLKK